jgi:hypothetical protein
MSVAEHAERILTAWCAADTGQFNREVEDALGCDSSNTKCCLEREERELLHSVANRLRFSIAEPRGLTTRSNGAGLALLRHLMNRSRNN